MTFIEKYKGNVEMQEVMKQVDQKLIGSPAAQDQAKLEMIYESMYGFKKVVAEEYNIPMYMMYDKLSHLYGITIDGSPFQLDSFTHSGGITLYNLPLDPERPCAVYINPACVTGNNVDRYMGIGVHEMCHVLTADYTLDENNKLVYSPYEHARGGSDILDEMANEDIANRITDYLGYQVPSTIRTINRSSMYSSEGTDVMYVGNGYQSVISLTSSVIDGDFIRSKFMNQELDKSKDLQPISNAATMIVNDTQGKDINHTAQYGNIAKNTVLLGIQESEQGNDFAQYMNTSAVYVMGFPTLSLDGNQESFQSAKVPITFTKGNPYELMAFYPKELTESQAFEPNKRTQDQNNFLMAINGLRMVDGLEFTPEALSSMKYDRIDEHNVVVRYDDRIYQFTGGLDTNSGAIYIEEMNELSSMPQISLMTRTKMMTYREQTVDDTNNYRLRLDNSSITSLETHRYNSSSTAEEAAVAFILNQEAGVDISHLNELYKSQKDFDFSVTDEYGNNLMHALAMNRDVEKVKEFIESPLFQENKAEFQAMLEQENDSGHTPFMLATSMTTTDLYADADTLLVPDSETRYPNFAAIDYISKNLDTSAETDAIFSQLTKNGYGRTVSFTHRMLAFERPDIVATAIEQGLDPNTPTSVVTIDGKLQVENTIFWEAVDSRNPNNALIQTLINHGADVNQEMISMQEGLETETALIRAINNQDLSKVSTVIAASPDTLGYQTESGTTALLSAICDKEMIRSRSMTEKMDVKQYTKDIEQSKEIINTLVAQGADVNQAGTAQFIGRESEENCTPIVAAVNAQKDSEPDYELVTSLIRSGANMYTSSENGMSAYDKMLSGDKEMLRAIAEAGVDIEGLHLHGIENYSALEGTRTLLSEESIKEVIDYQKTEGLVDENVTDTQDEYRAIYDSKFSFETEDAAEIEL